MPEDLNIERELGRAFERFYEEIEDQVELLREAIPAVANHLSSWEDIRNVAPELKIPAERVDELALLWNEELGSYRFDAILRPSPPRDAEPDEAGHGTVQQPEADAQYPTPVVEFIYKHGSFLALQTAMRRYHRVWHHVFTIAKASIVFAIGALESAIADVERVRLRAHIGAAGTKEKEFSLDELIRLGDIESVVENAVERRVEKLAYGGLEDWNDWYQKSFRRPLKELALDWETIEEIMQRRHVIAHNHCRVSRLYLERTAQSADDLPVGTYLPLPPEYVFRGLDEIAVLGLRLFANAWSKLGDDPEHISLHLRNRTYDALVAERWAVTVALADFVCEIAPEGSQDRQLAQVNRWLARIGQGEDVSQEVESWDVNALAVRFKCAKAALLSDLDEVRRLIPLAVRAGELERAYLLSWPLFRSLRSDPIFVEVLAEMEDDGDDGSDASAVNLN